jgi:glycosyltransferase involved in cell wall biosynthesis
MKFSIITPSFRSSRWLKLCIPSVADQGVPLEHLVQDSCSDDGTQEWLPSDTRVRAFIEKDQGMYDAVNRGLRRAGGELMAYLNCDEQYLPGALDRVARFFSDHPDVEVVFAHAIVVDPKGGFICYRKALLPQIAHSLVSNNLSFLTCATFFRRSLLEGRGLYFDTRWRNAGDAAWGVGLVRAGVRMAVLDAYTSTFTDTGENMNLNATGVKEKALLFDMAPGWARVGRGLVVAHFRLRRVLAGHLSQAPFTYSIYTEDSPARRVDFRVDHPTPHWVRREA